MASGTIKAPGTVKFEINKTALYDSGTIDGYISGNVVTIYFSVLKLTSATAWSNIATIPSGYRPKISINATLYSDVMSPVAIYIGSNGGIQSTGGMSTSSNYSGAITYLI